MFLRRVSPRGRRCPPSPVFPSDAADFRRGNERREKKRRSKIWCATRRRVGLYFDIPPSLSFRRARSLAPSPCARARMCVCVCLSILVSPKERVVCITQCNGIPIRRLTFPFHKARASEFGTYRNGILAPSWRTLISVARLSGLFSFSRVERYSAQVIPRLPPFILGCAILVQNLVSPPSLYFIVL